MLAQNAPGGHLQAVLETFPANDVVHHRNALSTAVLALPECWRSQCCPWQYIGVQGMLDYDKVVYL